MDAAAVGALFQAHADDVYRHLYRLTRSREQAEDLVGSVFLIAWQRRRRIPAEPDAVLAWLLTVATHVAQNSARSRRRYDRALKRVGLSVVADHADAVAASVDAARQLDQVHEAMRTLPGHEQEALRMVARTDQDVTEAAEQLGLPVGTVSSRLSRGRRRLRDTLHLQQKEARR